MEQILKNILTWSKKISLEQIDIVIAVAVGIGALISYFLGLTKFVTDKVRKLLRRSEDETTASTTPLLPSISQQSYIEDYQKICAQDALYFSL